MISSNAERGIPTPITNFEFVLKTKSTHTELSNTILFRQNMINPDSANFYAFRIVIKFPEYIEIFHRCHATVIFKDLIDTDKKEIRINNIKSTMQNDILEIYFLGETVFFKNKHEKQSIFNDIPSQLNRMNEQNRIHGFTTEVKLSNRANDFVIYNFFSEVFLVGLCSTVNYTNLDQSPDFYNFTSTFLSTCQKETKKVNYSGEHVFSITTAPFNPYTVNYTDLDQSPNSYNFTSTLLSTCQKETKKVNDSGEHVFSITTTPFNPYNKFTDSNFYATNFKNFAPGFRLSNRDWEWSDRIPITTLYPPFLAAPLENIASNIIHLIEPSTTNQVHPVHRRRRPMTSFRTPEYSRPVPLLKKRLFEVIEPSDIKIFKKVKYTPSLRGPGFDFSTL